MRLISEATMPAPWGGCCRVRQAKGKDIGLVEVVLETTVQRVRQHSGRTL